MVALPFRVQRMARDTLPFLLPSLPWPVSKSPDIHLCTSFPFLPTTSSFIFLLCSCSFSNYRQILPKPSYSFSQRIMGGDIFRSPSLLFLLFFLFHLTNFASAKGNGSSSTTATFTPPDNYLINCGSTQPTRLDDGRTFKSDHDTTSLLQTDEEVQASVDSISINASSSVPPSSLPLFLTAKIFPGDSTYTFFIAQPGWHWIRLYFYPLAHPTYNLTDSVFSVYADNICSLAPVLRQGQHLIGF